MNKRSLKKCTSVVFIQSFPLLVRQSISHVQLSKHNYGKGIEFSQLNQERIVDCC